MHELSICSAIAKIAERTAAGRTVQRVRVDIGDLRQVVPDSLRASWEMVVFGTFLDGAALEVREVRTSVRCRRCETITALDEPILRCGSCGSYETTVLSGDELSVTSLDVVDDEGA